MERRGSKHLRIAATLELLMGAALIAGTFLGIALANKKSFLTVACGFICFIMQLSAFFQSGNGGLEIAV